MNFNDFSTRFDEELIQGILGAATLKVLNIMDTSLVRLTNLQKALLRVHSPAELLENYKIRNQIFEILKEDEAIELCSHLGIDGIKKPYEVLKNTPFNSKIKASLFSFFEIEALVDSGVETCPPQKIVTCKYNLFPHQRSIIRDLHLKLFSGHKRAMLHMPTGSGKTRTAVSLASNHLAEYEDAVVIWLAHTEELCEQAAVEFEKAWSFLGNREILIQRYWGGGGAEINSTSSGLVVCGLGKLLGLIKKDASQIGLLAMRSTLIVMDEAHMAVAETYQAILEILSSFGTPILGLSATPGRSWNDREKDGKLANFFFKQKAILEIPGFENPVDFLIESGYLAKTKNTQLLYEGGISISGADLKYLELNFKLSNAFLQKLSEDELRNILIIEAIEKLILKHDRILFFGLSVEHSNTIAFCLQVKGLDSYSLTSSTSSATRKEIITKYKSDSAQPCVLCNYGILTTGFDAPRTSCAVIARPTDSLVLYSQMVGRAIRGKKAGGNDFAEIVTVNDTRLPGFDKIQNAFLNWEDVW